MDIKKTTLAVLAGMMVSGSVFADPEPKSDTTEIDLTIVDGSTGGGGGGGGDGKGILLLNGLSDIPLGEFKDGNLNPRNTSDFCIYASGVGAGNTFNVDLEVEGANNDDNFTLKEESSENYIKYKVDLFVGTDVTGTPANSLTAPNDDVAMNALSAVSINNTYQCTGENASVAVSAAVEDISSAPAGTYTDTLTLLVKPQ